MKKLKRLCCLSAAFTVCAFGFAGCGDGGETDGGTTNNNPPEPEKEAATYLRTDRDVYRTGEDIFITAGGGDDAWVGIYGGGDEISAENAVVSYSVNKDGMKAGMRFVPDSDLIAAGSTRRFCSAGAERIK